MQSEAAHGGGDWLATHSASAASHPVRKGHVVCSSRGRDQGRLYLVVDKGQDGFIYVADGTQRLVSRPKRKNPKHLVVLSIVAEGMAEAFAAGRKVTDAEVRDTLFQIKRSHELNGEEVDDTE